MKKTHARRAGTRHAHDGDTAGDIRTHHSAQPRSPAAFSPRLALAHYTQRAHAHTCSLLLMSVALERETGPSSCLGDPASTAGARAPPRGTCVTARRPRSRAALGRSARQPSSRAKSRAGPSRGWRARHAPEPPLCPCAAPPWAVNLIRRRHEQFRVARGDDPLPK
eukprot:scaffold4284_cov113-Isochrysis_galbana.AAC.14